MLGISLKNLSPLRINHLKSRSFFKEFESELKEELVRNQHGKEFNLMRTNSNLESYYKDQKICPTHEEWLECLNYMRKDLKQAYRINTSRLKTSKILKTILNKKMKTLKDIEVRNFDNMNTWQLNRSRWDISKDKLSKDTKWLHDFLVNESTIGNLSRQEMVSQIPVKLLDIQPHHKIVDLCAAPGSKTKQVIEALHSKGEGSIPEGFIIANEFNPSRLFRLWKSIKTVSTPCSIVVNYDGRNFPDFYLENDNLLKYDFVILDQPCSGDGTIRKNPNIWLNWTPTNGNKLFEMQYQIAKRGFQLLKIGGEMSYSSCSMNQIENEAVLDRILEESQGSLEIIDVSDKLNKIGMKSLPGLTQWSVYDKKMNSYTNINEVDLTLNQCKFIQASMFPVNGKYSHQLKNSRRFLPHLNNDGGFFVAIIKKKSNVPWENENINEKNYFIKGQIVREFSNKMFCYKLYSRHERVNQNENQSIKDTLKFYDINEHQIKNHLSLFSYTSKANTIYACNNNIKNIIYNPNNSHIKSIIQIGLPILKKQNLRRIPINYRIDKDYGGMVLLPFIGDNRVININRNDLEILLDSASDSRTMKNQNWIEFREKLSQSVVEQLDKLIDIDLTGGVKLNYYMKSQDLSINLLGVFGKKFITLEATKEQLYHFRLILEEFN